MADPRSFTGLVRLLGPAALPLLVPFACTLQSYGAGGGSGATPDVTTASGSGGGGGVTGSGGGGGMAGSGGADGGTPTCGDGLLDPGEDCDDANQTPGDGCTGCLNCNEPGDLQDPKSWHCYTYVTTANKTWEDARKDCQARGGDLAGISTPAEHDFLNVLTIEEVWIGGNDLARECVFEWTNGEPWYPNWSSGEPNNSVGSEDCVTLRMAGRFNDSNCGTARHYLCERVPKGGCGDAIVQPGEECDDGNEAPGDGCAACKIECNSDEIKNLLNRHCYHFVVGADKTWDEAQNACASAGSYLAAVSTPEEADFIKMHQQGKTWLGMRYSSFSWTWTTKEPNCWANWAEGQPSYFGEECVESLQDGKWNDDECVNPKPYVCERSPLGN